MLSKSHDLHRCSSAVWHLFNFLTAHTHRYDNMNTFCHMIDASHIKGCDENIPVMLEGNTNAEWDRWVTETGMMKNSFKNEDTNIIQRATLSKDNPQTFPVTVIFLNPCVLSLAFSNFPLLLKMNISYNVEQSLNIMRALRGMSHNDDDNAITLLPEIVDQ